MYGKNALHQVIGYDSNRIGAKLQKERKKKKPIDSKSGQEPQITVSLIHSKKRIQITTLGEP